MNPPLSEPHALATAAVRLPLDTQAERGAAHLRVGAAVIALLASAWLVWVSSNPWLRLVALAGVAFGLRWLLGLRRVRAVVAAADAHYLELSPERVTLASGDSQRRVAREDVQAVELDDDRLAVVLRLRSGEELFIEPVYGGLTLRELGETVHRTLFGAASTERPGDARD